MDTTLTRIRAILATTPQRWSQLVETLPEDVLRERPAPAEWSALQCLQHMLDTEREVFPLRLEALRNERDIPAFDPIQQGSQGKTEQSVAALVATFAQLRATALLALEAVREDEFSKRGQHSELGTVTLGEVLNEWATHDLDHTIQAERALMQPFLRACGPWQPFFAANRIDPK